MNPITMKLVVDDLILQALREDITFEDVSTASVCPTARPATVELIAKADGIIAGLDVFARTFELLDSQSSVLLDVADGDEVHAGDHVGQVRGDARVLLSGERVALNYLQRMSGIATYTHQMAAALEGTKTVLVDTRTICDYWIPRVLARHMAKHPDEMVQMSVGNTQELVEGLEAGTIDFALVEGSFNRALFDSAPVSRERYVAVGSADEFDASYKPVSMASLLDRRHIQREAGSGTREILEKHLAARDLDLDDFAGTLEVASIPAIKLCVRAGTGITFLYRAAVERELDQGELRDITPSDFFVEHDFRLIWQRGSLAARRYQEIARSWRR